MNCATAGTIFAAQRAQSAWGSARGAFLFLILFAAAFVLPSSIHAQANGSFSGTIVDKSGSSVPGASVTATELATGLARVGKTDDTGHYLIPLLPVGNYTVRVESSGFQSVETKDLNLQVDQARELNFTLSPASVSTTVTVAGDAVAAETSNPALGQVITSQQVSQLPLNGRNFVQLATLTAGATAETNPNSFFTSGSDSEVAARGSFSLSVGGSRPNSTDWLLDGVDNNELTAGGVGVFSSVDDIAEFKVLTYTYSAEFGTRAGPTVLITTRSGTNAFHGTLYEFVRNTAFDAKADFDTTTPKFNLNDFGGSIGGPIRHDKTFFFVDGEQKYQREGITFTGLVPSLAMRSGDFSSDAFGNPVSSLVIANPNMIGASTDPATYPNVFFQCDPSGNPYPAGADGSQPQGTPCNKIPSNLIDSVGQAMMNIYPAPNANAGNSNASYNYINEPVRSLDQTRFDARVDETLTGADNLFARFSYDQANSFVPGGAPGLAEANPFGSNETLKNHARNIALGWSHVFSPTLLNQATFGYDRIFNYIASSGNFTCASAKLGIPYANLGCSSTGTPIAGGEYSQGLVSTEFTSGYWALGDRGYSPFQGGTNIFSFKDDLDIIRGKHDIHVGLDLRANQMNVGTNAFGSGFWLVGTFGNFSGSPCPAGSPSTCVAAPGDPEADFLMGLTGGAIHDQVYNGAVTGRRWKIWRPFVEDDWRILPSLTLNLGLAYNMTTPITEVANRMSDYIPETQQLLIAGQNGVSRSAGINMFWGAYEPRIGLAWKVLGHDNTVLRAGFGIYHDSTWNQGAQGLWQNPPNLGESDQFPTTFSAGCAFATSYCAATLGQTPELNFTTSTGFTPLPVPQDVSTFVGTYYYQPRNFQPGRIHQYNVNVQREVPGNVLITAGYAGMVGGHILVIGNNLNTDSPSGCGTIPNYTLGCLPNGDPYIYPYNPPNYNAIILMGDVGKTHYNSLQVKAETKTAKHGLYALVAYTYSRTYDNGLSDGLGSELSAPYFPLPNWQNLDWSLSQINLNHSFTGSIIYDLPFGHGKQFGSDWSTVENSLLGNWRLTLIERISSGFPVPLIDSNNTSGTTFNTGGDDYNYNRPDRVPGCNPYSANHSFPHYQWINASCFVAAPVGQLGNAARVPVVGPDFVNSDFSVIKQFALPREMGLDFRAEFFNLFNHPQYGAPINDINASGFGSVDSTVNNPRLIQLGLKLSF
ncbi:MAG TPA: carboxypeptidase-like regulatory domain-containing protein [Acidobacteriaceae bacterium]